MAEARDAPAEPFEDLGQQREASELGMWVFLATEVLFFAGLFLGYAVYRHLHPEAFVVAARETDVVIGSVNTAVLLTSSLFAALAVKRGDAGDVRGARLFLLATIALGVLFLLIKAHEYRADLEKGLWIGPGFALSPPATQIFFSFYWVMTGIHAVHVIVGVGIFIAVYGAPRRGAVRPRRTAGLEVPALYWHFVDIVWIFLYPALYLGGRTG